MLIKKKELKENAGKLILDLAKLTFGSLVLGGVIRGNIPESVILSWGITGSLFGSIIGLLLISTKEKER